MISTYTATHHWDRAKLEAQLSGYKFSEPLYRRIPGDIDFLARGFRVDKAAGAEAMVIGPKQGDNISIRMSGLQPAGIDEAGNQKYQSQFEVSGVLGSNVLKGSFAPPVPIAPNSLAGPLNAGVFEFFVFVERVDVDYVYLTIARRPLNLPNIKIQGAQIPLGLLRIAGQRPDPILLPTPDDRK